MASKSDTKSYDPLKAGSIDGTDTVPHDRAIIRAMNSVYVPPKLDSNKYNVLFVGHLPRSLNEKILYKKFSRVGEIKSCKIIRDIVTGKSQGYGFVEYYKEREAKRAYHEMNGMQFEGRPAVVDWEVCRALPGWIPRRLGGGWGGKKESGQLRFGCRERAWQRPIVVPKSSRDNSIVPKSSRGDSVVVPKSSRGDSIVVPKSSRGDSIAVPKSSRGDSIAVPKSARGASIVVPKSSRGASILVPKSSRGDVPKSSRGYSIKSSKGDSVTRYSK